MQLSFDPLERCVQEQTASRVKALLAVVGLTLVGATLRLLTLNTRSFWLDETTSVRQASWPIPELIDKMAGNVHPLLFHFSLHAWIKVFGRSEVAVRSFAVTFGILAIPLMYWAATAIYGRRVGVISAAIIAVSPFYIWYSQEARMYTLMLVFAVTATGFMWKAMETNRWWWWLGYALSVAAGGFTQFFFVFLIMSQSVYFLLFKVIGRERALRESEERRFTWKQPWGVFADVPELPWWLGSMVVMLAPQAWWIPKVLKHKELLRGVAQPFNYGWAPPSLGFHFNELILVPAEWAFGFHSNLVMRDLVSLWPLLLTIAFLLVGYAGKVSERTRFLLVSGVGGATAIALLGMWQPILEARYFTAVTVPVVILSARLFVSFKPWVFRALVVAVVLIGGVAWADQSLNPDSIIKWDNREAMSIVGQGYQPGDVVLLFPNFASSVPEYYLPPQAYAALTKLPLYDDKGQPRNTPALFAQDLSKIVGRSRRVWIIATWQETPRIALDRAISVKWLQSKGFTQQLDRSLRQVRISLYQRPEEPKPDFFIQPSTPATGTAP